MNTLNEDVLEDKFEDELAYMFEEQIEGMRNDAFEYIVEEDMGGNVDDKVPRHC